MPSTLAAPRNLSRLLRLAALGTSVIVAATVMAVAWQLAARFDADARASALRMIEGGVQAKINGNEVVTRDYADWTEAFEAVRNNDVAWLDSNIGAGAYSTGTMDVVVLDGSGLHEVLGWTAEGIEGLGAAGLAALAAAGRRLAEVWNHQPNDQPVSTFVRIADTIWLISVDRIIYNEMVDIPADELALFVSGLTIDQEVADLLGETFVVSGLTFGTEAPEGHDFVVLEGLDGPLALLHWPHPQPGTAALAALALPLALALMLVSAALGFGTLTASRLAGRLERALVTSQAADRTKAEFIATLSHELRTPMNGIVGMLDILSTTDLTEDQADCVRVALDSAETQLQLIDRLLRFGQIEAGQAGLTAAPFQPEALLHEVVALARPEAEAKGLALTLETVGPAGAMLMGDRLAIRQIAVNLLGNAVKFTDSGQVRVQLAVKPSLGVQRLQIRVHDSGPGIGPADRDRIFGSFVQADSTAARRHGGVGLGLAISRQLAEALGGTLVLADSGEPGACFVFEVPLDIAEPAETPIGAAA